MANKTTEISTLTLVIKYAGTLSDVIENAREVIDKAREQGAVSGHLDLRTARQIDIEELF